jgi:hypothetical protein
MTKYRVINKSILADNLDQDEAYIVVEHLRIDNPNTPYEIEEYKLDSKLMGRDPDLH